MYPEVAKDISQGNQEISSTIWNAFTKVTGLYKFFSFTPGEGPAWGRVDKTIPNYPYSK
jgi:hypothetical protein